MSRTLCQTKAVETSGPDELSIQALIPERYKKTYKFRHALPARKYKLPTLLAVQIRVSLEESQLGMYIVRVCVGEFLLPRNLRYRLWLQSGLGFRTEDICEGEIP